MKGKHEINSQIYRAMSHHISEYLGLAEGKWRKSLYNNEKSSIKNDIHMKRHFQLIYGL